MAGHSHKPRGKRPPSALEEEELRSLRVPAHRGSLSPSRNSYLPTLQGDALDASLQSAALSPSSGARSQDGRSLSSRQGGSRLGSAPAPDGIEGASSTAGFTRKPPPPSSDQEVLSDLSAELLESVKQEFDGKGGALVLDEFVRAMLRCLEPNLFSDRDMRMAKRSTSGLRFLQGSDGQKQCSSSFGRGSDVGAVRTAAVIDLFQRVDVHGEGSITWEQVSNFLIDQGLTGSEQFVVDSMKTYELSPVADQSKHESSVEKLVYLEQMDAIVCMSQSSRQFRLYEPTRCALRHEVSGHRGSVINCCYVDAYSQLVTTSADMTVCMWDATSLALRSRIPTKDVQLCAQWDSSCQSLFTGSIDGTLSRWDLQRMCLADAKRGHHKKAITDLLMVDDIDLLASASADGSILMWDTELMRPTKAFKGHKKGAFSLAYSNEYRCLLTAGLDQEALVWNPYVERVPIFRLKGHTHSLCGVAVVPGTPQILSADVVGTFRLWDMRNFRCVQSFGGPDMRGSDLNSFCMMPPHRRLAAGGSRITMYNYMDEWGGENVTDVGGVSDALYNPNAGEFYTLSQRTIKAWAADSGVLFKVMKDIAEEEITAACMSDNGRKIYLGDAAGRVAAHNINNGKVLMDFDAHATDISSLAVWHGTNRFFSASWDGVVKVQTDMGSRRPQMKAEFRHHRDGVTCLCCCPELMLLATGGTDMQVCLYDLKTLKLDHTLSRLPHVVAGLDFLPARCLLAMVDQGGLLSIWRVRPHPGKWTRVYYLRNLPSVGNLSLEAELGDAAEQQLLLQQRKLDETRTPIAFSAVLFASPEAVVSSGPMLYTSDIKGGLRCWDMSLLCERRSIVDCDLPALFEREYYVQLKMAGGGGGALLRHSQTLEASMPMQASNGRGASSDGGPFLTALAGDDDAAGARGGSGVGGGAGGDGGKIAAARRSAGTKSALAGKGASATSPAADVQLLFETEGHGDAVIGLHIGTEPWTLLTCGLDRRVCTWSAHLESFGVLLQSGDNSYQFPYDRAGAHEAKVAEAAEVLQRMRPWSPTSKLPPLTLSSTKSAPDLSSIDGASRKTSKGKKDFGAAWRITPERIIEDPFAREEDYLALSDQMERMNVSVLPAPIIEQGSRRLQKSAGTRSTGCIPQRLSALSKEEAAAADRLARAMSALGGDDFGTFATLANSIRPKGRGEALASG